MEDNEQRNKIRNFAIIAHIDHGKSTLADRIMEITGNVSARDSKDRMLDTLELEQERGITIKMQTARMNYQYSGKNTDFISEAPYIINLVDTPGHVDFSYEVSRSLAAAEGAVLLVDATQGIQAQTLTTVYKAFEYNLEIIPVINKIDLPSANVEQVKASLVETFAFDEDDIILTSGKTGLGVTDLLNAIIEKVPCPNASTASEPRAFVYDSFYHEHKGVVALVKIVDGSFAAKDEIVMIGSSTEIEPVEIGYVLPQLSVQDKLKTGEIGYIATGLKDIRSVHAGDTITLKQFEKKAQLLPGYVRPKPMVYASLYPIDADDFPQFQEALEKLALNDPAISFQKENSQALGSGFSCGFLGLLHMEVTQERLEREFDIDLITTTPSVEYKLELATKDYSKVEAVNMANIDIEGMLHIRNAAEFPDPSLINKVYEPWVEVEILTPEQYIGGIMELATKRRGLYKTMDYLSSQHIAGHKHVLIKYDIPTAEIIIDFFDQLKSLSQGYASLDYTFKEYKDANIVKVALVVNYETIEALSFLTHTSNAEYRGRETVKKLKELIPRQQFKIPIQASIGAKVIARETIPAYRKDVTAKLYGGDITRKKKLLEKQKKGKKRMKQFGSVELPKDVFIKALKTN